MIAIIPLSGGIDSTVMLAKALADGRQCIAISFDYGQRHRLELRSAKCIASSYKVPHKVIRLDTLSFGESSLTAGLPVPKNEELNGKDPIPSTFVPARNLIFLAHLVGHAIATNASEVYFGANADDHDAYPDCRPDFFENFQKSIKYTTRECTDEAAPKLITPLINMTKGEIIKLGMELKAPLEMTLSCYDPSPRGNHCGQCLSCKIREKGFAEAELATTR